MLKQIIETSLNLVPEKAQLEMGNFLWRGQMDLGILFLGARKESINVNGIKTSYITMGDPKNEVYIALPGFSDSKESYLVLGKLLSTKYRFIAVDVPGFGESEHLPIEYSAENYALWFYNFTLALGIKKFHGFGNSLGGAILGEYAHLNQDSLLSITLACSAGIFQEEVMSFYSEYQNGKNLFLVNHENDFDLFLDRLFFKKPLVPYPIQKFLYLKYKNNKEHFTNIMNGLTKDFLGNKQYLRLEERYSKLETNTLVIWGQHDSLFPVSYGELLSSYIPNSRFKVIQNSGHLPHVETPRKLASEIWDFLN
ncbi:MAG: alpha/beta hydrolase [Leptospiraceae bacterium]|nr:alpha/beta hydrolase [Leptospiraceae bacterium]